MDAITTSIADAGRALNLGRTTVNQLIKTKKLESVKIGRRRLIKTDSIRRLLETAGDHSLSAN